MNNELILINANNVNYIGTKNLVDSIRLDFDRVEISKPLASRNASSEFYLVCRDYRR